MTSTESSPGSVTRRALVGTAAGVAAGAALPRVAWPQSASASASGARRVDVVVVGAGLSGLAAARRLKKMGASVAVLEARDRVGGRTYTVRQNGTFFDVGGQFIGPTQNRIIALSKAMGVESFEPFNSGDNLLDYNGKVSRWTTTPPLPQHDLVGYALANAALEHMAQEVPPEAAWEAPHAEEWDSQTYRSWLDENVDSPGARALLELEFFGSAIMPGEGSLLMALQGLAAGPHSEKPETSRFVGGAQQISERLAHNLGRKRVFLRAPVRSIKHAGGVTVESGAGKFKAQQVIVAIPPTLAQRIAYHPALPALRDGWTQHVAQGSVIKCQAVYRTPWWRDKGLSGHAISNVPPLFLCFDNGPPPPDDRPGVLLGFTTPSATRLLYQQSASARRKIVLEAFAGMFGAKARSPIAYVEGNWSAEPWTRGCYSGIPTPGALIAFGRAQRAPVGRIHWAATESASRWGGYMDGAVRAGETAADEALAELGATVSSGRTGG